MWNNTLCSKLPKLGTHQRSAPADQEEEADYNLYQQLTEEEAPSDQQWLRNTEELEKTLKGMLGANFLAASTTADPTLREVRDCVEQKD